MKISKGKRTEKNLIISAIAMLLISTLLFGLGSEQGINFIKNLKNALNPISSIDVSSKSNEILKNQIANAKIVGGANHFAALTADGKVYSWGYNGYGNLGTGNTTNYSTPVYSNIDNVIDVVAGYYYTAALKKDGTVWMTGYNADGELGVGDTENKLNFVQVKNEDGTGFLNNIKSIFSGTHTMYAITNDNEVYTWGYNGYGQMGFGDTKSRTLPTKTTLQNIKQIAIGENHTLALTENGQVFVSGKNSDGQLGINTTSDINTWSKMKNLNGTGEMSNAKSVSAGINHTMVLTNDGYVYATGYNGYYQLADGTSTSKSYLIPMTDKSGSQIKNVKEIYAQGSNSVVITEDGTVMAVGNNKYGHLIQGNSSTVKRLTKVNIDCEVKNIAITKHATLQTTAYVDEIGRIFTVGYSGNGELGNGTTDTSYMYKPYSISDYKILDDNAIINLKANETKYIEPYFAYGLSLINKDFTIDLTYESLDTDVATVSNNKVIGVGVGTTYIRISDKTNKIYGTVKVNVNENDGVTYPKVAAGENHFVALKSDGTTYVWGYNGNGQLGTGDTSSRLEPTKTNVENAIDVAAGYQFTAILKNDGTVWMSGNNGYGQLADGTTTSSNTFKKANISDVIAISAGSSTMHALKKDGTVWSWGLNSYGEYGNNATSSLANYVPCKMSKIPNIMQLASGESHIAMIAADGSVWAVGRNGEGQLGLGNTTDIYVPTQMVSKTGSGILTGVKEISCNIYSTSLITDSGDVYAVGQNNYGQLATKDTQNKSVIVPMLDSSSAQLKNVNHIYSAGYATFATKNENGLYVTGYASCAQNFTQSTSTRKYLYKTQENKKIIAMALTRSTGKQTGIIVDDKGYIYTVGYNGNGEIGNGTVENRTKEWELTGLKVNVDQNNIINLKNAGDTSKIKYDVSMKLNLLTDNIKNSTCTFKSMDESVAKVDSDTGIITAVSNGTTFIKLYNSDNSIYSAVKVNVNGSQGTTYPKVVAGYNNFIALKSNGSVYGWGYNGYGQLGTNDYVSKDEPTKMFQTVQNIDGEKTQEEVENIIDIAAGYYHTLVLKEDGTVWATGLNSYGQLGNGNKTSQATLTKVKGPNGVGYLQNVVAIAAGELTSYALMENGEVYSWGYNSYGQFGVNNTSASNYPVKMKKVSNIIQISAGEDFLLMLDADGSVWGVGANGDGQLGLNNTSSMYLPQQMLKENGSGILYGVKEIATGRYS